MTATFHSTALAIVSWVASPFARCIHPWGLALAFAELMGDGAPGRPEATQTFAAPLEPWP